MTSMRPYAEGPWPRTVVAQHEDPVAQARAELKAALAAIEDKANVPKRVAIATDRNVHKARVAARENPSGVAVAVVAVAAVVGLVVWGAVYVYTRKR